LRHINIIYNNAQPISGKLKNTLTTYSPGKRCSINSLNLSAICPFGVLSATRCEKVISIVSAKTLKLAAKTEAIVASLAFDFSGGVKGDC
jgi:hypothetical protein